MTEQELKEEFEKKFLSENYDIFEYADMWRSFHRGYSLAQETIKAKDAEIEDLKIKLNSALGELGYSVPGNTPALYKCGLCDAKAKTIAEARVLVSQLLKDGEGFGTDEYLEEKAKAWLADNSN